MAYCVKCGAKVDDDLRFCPQCGAEIPHIGSYENYGNQGNTESTVFRNDGHFDASEVKSHKGMGVLSYIGILVLIPLLAGDKRSAYIKHHINQGLCLYLISVMIDFLNGKWVWNFQSWLNLGGGPVSWLLEIVDFAVLILMVMGIVSACKGTTQELPIIGKIKILK